ncbi:hypothetical protein TCAP_06753, partial [Tolypocladium capitatum]
PGPQRQDDVGEAPRAAVRRGGATGQGDAVSETTPTSQIIDAYLKSHVEMENHREPLGGGQPNILAARRGYYYHLRPLPSLRYRLLGR